MKAEKDPIARAAGLTCWSGRVTPEPLTGGITNKNFVVRDRGMRFVVRIGDDIPVHQVMRFNELAASNAAAAAGLSPPVIHHEPGALVFRFIEGKTLTADDVRPRAMLTRILPLIRRCHVELPKHLRGPALIFWVFHILRDYAGSLHDAESRSLGELPRLLAAAAELEAMVGPIDVVYGHNDLLPGNFIDDGKRLWLIDWESVYRNDPLVDVATALDTLAPSPELEDIVLRAWLGHAPDEALRARLELIRALTRLYYAGVLLSASAAASWTIADTDLAAPTLAQFQQAIREGRFKAGAPQTKHVLGKMFLASFFSGVAPPGFDIAV